MPEAAEKDFYGLLGVSENAGQDEIRKAYLKLAREYHPDKTGGDKAAEEKLKEINNAYDVLKNPEKRKRYDELRNNPWASAAGGGAQPGSRGGTEGFGGGFGGSGGEEGFGYSGSFEDLFGDLFGQRQRAGGAQAQRRQPGEDLEARLDITLQEAAKGASKTLRVARTAQCGACGGSGAAPGSQPQTCPECNGSGMTARGSGNFLLQQACPRCRGRGQVITNPCTACNGRGKTREERKVRVNIPGGAQTGTRLRMAGQGNAGDSGAPAGDLYVRLRVKEDSFFTRTGNDISCEVPITFAQAALGAKVRVPTLNGKADLNIPAGTSSGKTFRLRGQGMPQINGSRRGDQLVTVQIEVPDKLNTEQEELIRKLAERDNTAVYPKRRSFLSRLKNFTESWAAVLLGLTGWLAAFAAVA
jgi:molecular chaperone DnaJ